MAETFARYPPLYDRARILARNQAFGILPEDAVLERAEILKMLRLG